MSTPYKPAPPVRYPAPYYSEVPEIVTATAVGKEARRDALYVGIGLIAFGTVAVLGSAGFFWVAANAAPGGAAGGEFTSLWLLLGMFGAALIVAGALTSFIGGGTTGKVIGGTVGVIMGSFVAAFLILAAAILLVFLLLAALVIFLFLTCLAAAGGNV